MNDKQSSISMCAMCCVTLFGYYFALSNYICLVWLFSAVALDTWLQYEVRKTNNALKNALAELHHHFGCDEDLCRKKA